LLGLVTLQAAFGMWTVTLGFVRVVTAHLLGGFATLSLLFLLTLRLAGSAATLPKLPHGCAAWRRWAFAGDRADRLGGWVSSNYAAVACVDLPTCHA
jgi:cytochrome c oxidase assembly protein subunit 15